MITVENLTSLIDGRAARVLDAVSFAVGDGSVCGVVGAPGAGKSTLARCLAAELPPDSGTVVIDDRAGSGSAAIGTVQRGTGVGLLSGDAGPAPELSRKRTVAGNVALPLQRNGLTTQQRRARTSELLDLVGLAEYAGAACWQLGPGQRRRLELAVALGQAGPKPSALVLDEPTANLEPSAAVGVLAAVERVAAELDVAVVLLTDDPSVVRRVCHEVVVLCDGRVVEHGNLLSLATTPGSGTAALTLPEVPVRAGADGHARGAEVVLVGFAAVGALLAEASARFDVEIAILGGGFVRFGDTPVARFGVGVSGAKADSALAWIAAKGGVVEHSVDVAVPAARGPRGVAA